MSRSVGTTHPQPSWDDPPAVVPHLARSGDAEIVAARQHRDRLVDAAVELVAACAHDPDVAVCDEARCRLAELSDGPAICSVAHALAGLAAAPYVPIPVSTAEAVAEFRARLLAAADAIRHCRQAEHGSGSCWFSSVPDHDGCRAVLRLLHLTS